MSEQVPKLVAEGSTRCGLCRKQIREWHPWRYFEDAGRCHESCVRSALNETWRLSDA